jgi:mannose/fructose/N-acetylgalactosamine-specific phosphotransferase system component IID
VDRPPITAFLRTALRLLVVQACWNYERMLGVGLGYATEPLLRALPGGRGGERYRGAMSRAARYFNAHPYLTGLAAGALARAEHEGVPGERIERLRTALLGPLGAVGDRLVWAGTLPAASAVGLALSASARAGVGALALLALYNVPHVILRVWGLHAGWQTGTALARALAEPVLTAGLRLVGPAAALGIGFALPFVAHRLAGGLDLPALGVGLGSAAGAWIAARWLAPTLGGVRLGLLATVAVLLGAWL